MCALPLAAPGQANLLLNSDFGALALDATLPPWVLDGAEPVVADPGAAADFAVQLRTSPSGAAAAMAQEVTLPGALAAPTRARFAARLRREGAASVLPEVALDLGAGLLVPLEPTGSVAPLGDGFHPVEWTAVLPGAPAAFVLRVGIAGGALSGHQWHLDDADLRLEPLAFQTNPGAAAPNQQIQIASPALGTGSQAQLGGQPAQVIAAGPGFLTCLVPPPPPDWNPNLFLPVTVGNPGTGQILADAAAFRYRLPIVAGGPEPAVVSSAGGTPVRVTGLNFTADTILIDLTHPARPPVVPDLIESTAALVFTMTASQGPEVTWQIASPSAPGGEAVFTLQVEDPPLVGSVLPESGPPAGGTAVMVTGAGFQPGALALFDGQPATATTFVSPTELLAVAPAHPMERVVVTVANPSGVASPEPGIFHLEGVRADVNGNDRADPEDVMLALDAVLSATATEPLHLDADVDGDARIGLPEAIAALEFTETGSPGAVSVDPPTVLLTATEVVAGETVFALVTSVQFPYELSILWGDGAIQPITELQGQNPVAHVYDRPGTFGVRLLWSPGFTEPVPLAVVEAPRLTGASMILQGTDETGQPVAGRSGHLDPAAPASIRIELEAVSLRGSGLTIEGLVRLSGPGMEDRFDLPWVIPVAPASGGGPVSGTVDVPLPLPQLLAPGEYFAKLVLGSPLAATGVAPPNPVTFSLDGFVTEEDCHELEREWQDIRLEKAAKQNDCEELKKRLEACRQELANLEAARAAAIAAISGMGGLDEQIGGKQAEYDALFASVNQFLSGVGMLVGYPAGGGAPPGGQFVGARKSSASAGVGIQFDDAQSLLDRMDLYKKLHGHSIGRDLNKLRDCIARIDALKDQKAAKEAEIAALDARIAALQADIAAKEAALAACLAECDALEQELEDFAQAHADKLEQLEKQRESEAKIGESERRADELGGTPDQVDDAADEAGDTIGGRAGTPGQAQQDEDKVDHGRDCAEIARQKIAQARQKQAEARAALAMGDTVTANQKTDEANTLLDEAEQKLKDASDSIREGRSSALGRKPRQCADGDFVMRHPDLPHGLEPAFQTSRCLPRE